eukprot:scaffold126371_cov22-Prasinocladus_malaysianus.AAC.1
MTDIIADAACTLSLRTSVNASWYCVSQNIVREMELHPVSKPLIGYPQDSLPLCAEGVEAHFLALQV